MNSAAVPNVLGRAIAAFSIEGPSVTPIGGSGRFFARQRHTRANPIVERFPWLASPARRCIDNFAAVQRGLGTWWWPPAAQMMRGRELPPSSPSVGRNSEADDRGRPFFRQIRTSRVAVNQHSCQTDGALSATSSRNIARLHEVDLKQQRAFGPGAYSMVIIMRTSLWAERLTSPARLIRLASCLKRADRFRFMRTGVSQRIDFYLYNLLVRASYRSRCGRVGNYRRRCLPESMRINSPVMVDAPSISHSAVSATSAGQMARWSGNSVSCPRTFAS